MAWISCTARFLSLIFFFFLILDLTKDFFPTVFSEDEPDATNEIEITVSSWTQNWYAIPLDFHIKKKVSKIAHTEKMLKFEQKNRFLFKKSVILLNLNRISINFGQK